MECMPSRRQDGRARGLSLSNTRVYPPFVCLFISVFSVCNSLGGLAAVWAPSPVWEHNQEQRLSSPVGTETALHQALSRTKLMAQSLWSLTLLGLMRTRLDFYHSRGTKRKNWGAVFYFYSNKWYYYTSPFHEWTQNVFLATPWKNPIFTNNTFYLTLTKHHVSPPTLPLNHKTFVGSFILHFVMKYAIFCVFFILFY